MPRRRLGAAVLVPWPLAAEVDGLRRAVGDPGQGRVPAHCTVLSPVNVRGSDLGDALALLRDAAAATRPFTLAVGPPATFLPANPVLHLPVTEGAATMAALRERMSHPPLHRPATWPYVPHVTLAESLDPARLEALVPLLDGATLRWEVDRVHVLERGAEGVWRPLADAELGPPAVVGRGGLPLVLHRSGLVDPEAAAVLAAAGVVARAAGPEEPPHPDVVVTARRDTGVVGVGVATVAGDRATLLALVVAPEARREGVGTAVLATLEAALRAHDVHRVEAAPAIAPDFLAARGWASAPAPVSRAL